jgi:integration host factor subunit alpha
MHAAGELGLSVAEHTVDASQRTVQRTATRVDLAEAVYRCVGLSRKESAILVQSVLDELADALIAGESVKLSSFGRFLVRAKSERIGRNPKTGIEVPITQRRVMVFKPSNVLKARINGLAVTNDEDD